jgi:hypothetical protein
VPAIATILKDLRAARAKLSANSSEGANASATFEEKIHAAESALAAAAGVVLDAVSDREAVPPGESVTVTTSVWNAGRQAVDIRDVALTSPEGWQLPPAGAPRRVEPGKLEEWKFPARVQRHAIPTVPYFLRQPLRGALYDWTGTAPFVRGEPFQPPGLTAIAAVEIGGTPVLISREVTYRFRDEAFGEIRHAVRIVPTVEVSVEPGLVPWPIGRRHSTALEVSVSSNSSSPVSGQIEVTPPPDWPTIAARPFSLPERGRTLLTIPVSPSANHKPGRSKIGIAAVLADGQRIQTSIRVIDYEHIRPVTMPSASTVEISAMNLQLPAVHSIGYVRGAADRVPEALSAVGLPIQILSDRDLARGDLSRYDAIVIGSRAYETQPALSIANGRLLDSVRNGGLLIVQYQQMGFTEGAFAPEKLEIGRPIERVTDEEAPVKILEPTHPVFTTPNRIGPSDWEGWVQERGLYFPRSWAPAYTPLLSMADPGQPEQKGSLLVAKIGKGHYVYTGLAFFRQLPAGVPGAYRLFANLLAWRPAKP